MARVLNAFRHQRINHSKSSSCCPSVICAQRLSASTDKSHLAKVRSLIFPNVLNAFRHQRINHASMEPNRRRPSRAQRLSASTDKSRDNARFQCFHAVGAQRLSASTDKSLRTSVNALRLRFVLNAFRHQRINHLDDEQVTGLTG